MATHDVYRPNVDYSLARQVVPSIDTGKTAFVQSVDVVSTTPAVGGTYTDSSIANMTGASQTALAANASRRFLHIYNISGDPVGVNLTGGTASLTVGGSDVLAPGDSITLDSYPPTNAITVIGTLNGDLTVVEG